MDAHREVYRKYKAGRARVMWIALVYHIYDSENLRQVQLGV